MGQFFSAEEVCYLPLFCLISQIEDLEAAKITRMLYAGNEQRVIELESKIPRKTRFCFHLLGFGCFAYEIDRVRQRDCCQFTYLLLLYFGILGLIGLQSFTICVIFALIPFALVVLIKFAKLWLRITMGVMVIITTVIQIIQSANKWPNHPVARKVLLTLHLIIVVYSIASGIPLVYRELCRTVLDPVPDNRGWRHSLYLYGPGVATFSNVVTAVSSQIVITDESSRLDRFLGHTATGWVVTAIGAVGNSDELVSGFKWLGKFGMKRVREFVWLFEVVRRWWNYMMSLAKARVKGVRWGYKMAKEKRFRLD